MEEKDCGGMQIKGEEGQRKEEINIRGDSRDEISREREMEKLRK